MSKIRDDLSGVIHLRDGRTLSAGDDVPSDADVHDSLLAEDGESKPRRSRSKKTADE